MEKISQAFFGTKTWAKWLGIISIISFVFNLITINPISIISAVFTSLIPGILLIRYSRTVAQLEDSGPQSIDEIELACAQQGGYMKYMGIMGLVFIILFVIGVIAAIAIPGLAMGLSAAGA